MSPKHMNVFVSAVFVSPAEEWAVSARAGCTQEGRSVSDIQIECNDWSRLKIRIAVKKSKHLTTEWYIETGLNPRGAVQKRFVFAS